MDTISVVMGVCGLSLTVINFLIGIIIAYVFKAISRLEDRHIAAVGELHKKIEVLDHECVDKREKDLTEMRNRLGDIDLKLAAIEGQLKAI